MDLGARGCAHDEALLLWYQDDHHEGVLCLHVDNLFDAGVERWLEDVVAKVKRQFPVGKEERGEMIYLGMQVQTVLDAR